MSNNDENLIPFSERTQDEQREIAKKGGVASGKARRKKRSAKEAVKYLLNLPVKDLENIETLEEFGIDERDYTNLILILVKQFHKAMEGDLKAAEFLINTAGEHPKYQLAERRLDIIENELERTNDIIEDWVQSIPDLTDEAEDNVAE